MADVQKYFEKFHKSIRTDYELNSELAKKREIILDKIRTSLKDAGHPLFTPLLQGSYRMKTGVKPLPGREYDIDVGLRFQFEGEPPATSEVRGWVLSAIENHTKDVQDKGPCIRVNYAAGYHVDLVVYAVRGEGTAATFQLGHRDQGWISADPPALLQHVADAVKVFDGTEDSTGIDQLRRTVRYLKRWGDVALDDGADGKPAGLAYTLLAINELSPSLSFDETPDDLEALLAMTRTVAALPRICAFKPTPGYEDMFGHLTDTEMAALQRRFQDLRSALEDARAEVDPRVACQRLADVMGTDFPVPQEADDAVRTSAPAILTSSNSA